MTGLLSIRLLNVKSPARRPGLGQVTIGGSSACGLARLIEPSQGDAFIGGIAQRHADRPTARLPQFVAVRFPPIADAEAGVRNQAPQFGMIGELLAGLFEGVLDGENEQRMPAGGAPAIEA